MPFKWLRRRRNTLAAAERPERAATTGDLTAPLTTPSSYTSTQTEPRIRAYRMPLYLTPGRRKSFFQTLRGVRDGDRQQRKRASSFGAEAPIPKSFERGVPPVPPLPADSAPISSKFARAPPSAFPAATREGIEGREGRENRSRLPPPSAFTAPAAPAPAAAATAPARTSVPTVQLDDLDSLDQLSEFGVVNPLDALDRLDASSRSLPQQLPPRPSSTSPQPRPPGPPKKPTSMLNGPLPPPPPGATVTPTKRNSKRFSIQNAPVPVLSLPKATPSPSQASPTLPSPVPSSNIAPSPTDGTPISSIRRSIAQRALIPDDMRDTRTPSPQTPQSPSQDSPPRSVLPPKTFTETRQRRISMTTRKPVPKLTLEEIAMGESPVPSPVSPRLTGPVVPRSPRSPVQPGLVQVLAQDRLAPVEQRLAPAEQVLSPSISAVGLNTMGENGLGVRPSSDALADAETEAVVPLPSQKSEQTQSPPLLNMDQVEDARTDAESVGTRSNLTTPTSPTPLATPVQSSVKRDPLDTIPTDKVASRPQSTTPEPSAPPTPPTVVSLDSPEDITEPHSPVDFSQPEETTNAPRVSSDSPHSPVDFSTPAVTSTSTDTTMSQSPSASTDDWSSNTHSSGMFPVTPPSGLGSEFSMTSVDSISHSQTFGQLGSGPAPKAEYHALSLDAPSPSPTRSRIQVNYPPSPTSPPRRASSTSPPHAIPPVRTTSRTPSQANLRPVSKRSVTAPTPSTEPTLDDFMTIFRQVSQRPKDVSIRKAAVQAERNKLPVE